MIPSLSTPPMGPGGPPGNEEGAAHRAIAKKIGVMTSTKKRRPASMESQRTCPPTTLIQGLRRKGGDDFLPHYRRIAPAMAPPIRERTPW